MCIQRNYPMAIKMFRMAMDQMTNAHRSMRYRIMRNIGNAFVRLGQFSVRVFVAVSVGLVSC